MNYNLQSKRNKPFGFRLHFQQWLSHNNLSVFCLSVGLTLSVCTYLRCLPCSQSLATDLLGSFSNDYGDGDEKRQKAKD